MQEDETLPPDEVDGEQALADYAAVAEGVLEWPVADGAHDRDVATTCTKASLMDMGEHCFVLR